MAFGFNTGLKVLDNYYEAYFSVIKQYYKVTYKSVPGGNPFNSTILPTIRSTIASTRGIYLSGAYNNYYANLYKSFLSKKGIKKAFSGYNLSGINTAKILKKFGFGAASKSRLDSDFRTETSLERGSTTASTSERQPRRDQDRFDAITGQAATGEPARQQRRSSPLTGFEATRRATTLQPDRAALRPDSDEPALTSALVGGLEARPHAFAKDSAAHDNGLRPIQGWPTAADQGL